MILPILAIVASVMVGPQPQTVVKVYDVHDILCVVPDFAISVRLQLESALQHSPSIVAAQSPTIDRTPFDEKLLRELILNTVDPFDEGPTTIQFWKGSFIIKTTEAIHHRIQ